MEKRSRRDSSAPALAGRDRELAALRESLAVALAGNGTLVLIGGEAGIGKTALAEALCAEAAARGALVLVGRCYDLSETPPYGPWAEALARAPRDPALPAAPDLAGGGGAASQVALFAGVRDCLAALATRQPLVVLLDDLHWADPASLDLLRTLARQLGELPLLLLVTYRADELTRRHPLYALLPTLVREARAARLDLHPLDGEGLRALVGARYALAEADAARLVAYLHERAEGNAFYTGEVLRALVEAGALAGHGDGWALGDLAGVGVPPLLRQVIDARLDRLGDEARALLATAAVVGQAVPLDLWRAVAGADEEALLDTMERAVEARVLVATDDGARFAHALIREALYDSILPVRRRATHRRVAEALLATPGPDPDVVADHLRRAGDPRAGEWLERAGERAQRAYAWVTAAERYEAALALLEGRADQVRQRALLLLTLAQLRRYDQPERGLTAAEEAARLAVAAGDEALAAAARFDHGHLQCLTGRDLALGLAAMEAALPILEALPAAVRAGLPALVVQGTGPAARYHRGALVQWLVQSGRYGDALRYGAPCARREPGTTARGLAGLGMAYAALGRPAEARRAYHEARAAYLAAGQHSEAGHLWSGEFLLMVLPYETERRAEQAWLLDEAGWAYARARGTMGDHRASMQGLDAALPALWLDGRWAEARRRVAASPAPAHPWLPLALIARAQGEEATAWRMVRAHLPTGPASEPGRAIFHFSLTFLRLAAALALDAGDLVAARAWLEAHDRWLAWAGAVLGQAEGQLGWAAYHHAAADPALARHHAEAALAHASAPRQPLALLAAHRAIGELANATGRHADAAAHLGEALALADACAVPYERALTLLAVAELHAATGDRPKATAMLAEARALLEPLGALPALARADALAARLAAAPAALPFGLTAREAAVLKLVAEGLPDAEVASRLFVSRATVSTHLRAIYGKLGVTSRTAAARVAAERGLA